MTPIWKHIPADLAHRLAPLGLSLISQMHGEAPLSRSTFWRSRSWRGLQFRNPMGVAGGVDKNAEQCLHWQSLGAGFVEIGTVTPRPQKANPGKIIDRRWDDQILWNRMGFPSFGADEVYYNLLKMKSELQIPIFVNIGKNRETSKENAAQDYQDVAFRLAPLASGIVVNVSSPNTPGLRDLQAEDEMRTLIMKVQVALNAASSRIPILVKLSPDMTHEDFKACMQACLEGGASGFVLTNTTLSRPTVSDLPTVGGVSGAFLREKAEQALSWAMAETGGKKNDVLLISAGGILSDSDVKRRLELGADLLQVYSALVFTGPLFFQKMNQQFQSEKRL